MRYWHTDFALAQKSCAHDQNVVVKLSAIAAGVHGDRNQHHGYYQNHHRLQLTLKLRMALQINRLRKSSHTFASEDDLMPHWLPASRLY